MTTQERDQKLAEALRRIAEQLRQVADILFPKPYDPDQGR